MHPSFESKQQMPNGAAAILESITDAFFALNTEWQFTYVNRQAEKVLGHERGSLLGKTIWSMYPGLAGSEFESYTVAQHANRWPTQSRRFTRIMTDGMKSMSILPRSVFQSIFATSPNVFRQKKNYGRASYAFA